MPAGGHFAYMCSSLGKQSRAGEDGAKRHRFPRDGAHLEGEHPQVTKRERQSEEENQEDRAMAAVMRRYAQYTPRDVGEEVDLTHQKKKKPIVAELAQVWHPDGVFLGSVLKIEKRLKHTYCFIEVTDKKSGEKKVRIAPRWAVFFKK